MSEERNRHYTWSDPRIGAEASRSMSGLEYLTALLRSELPRTPIADTLDYRLESVEAGRAVFICTPKEFHYNPIGVVHGGLAATLLDSCMACAVHSLLPAGVGYTTLELKVNFVRALTLETGPIQAIGTSVHQGRTVATAEGRIVDASGKLYAHGTTTCLILGG